MVKGVHKKIIEIHHTGSDYFEKAVFYLKPDVVQLPPQVAEAAAQMILQELDGPPRRKKRWRKASVAVGVVCAVVLFTVCAVWLKL
jgi:hypothetical protein